MGDEFTILIGAENHVFATGKNTSGQLGLGDNVNRNQFTLVTSVIKGCPLDVSCGVSHSIILTKEDGVYVTGRNDFGQLGLGDNVNRNQFIQVQGIVGNPFAVSCGLTHSIILTEDGCVFATGDNSCGQLGLGDKFSRVNFVQVQGIVGNPFAVSCGRSFSIILTDQGVFGTGTNRSGQLGLGNNVYQDRFVPVQGIVGNPLAVSCGGHHSIILTNGVGGGVYVAGSNSGGQLGENIFERNLFTPLPGIIGNPFAVSCGSLHSIILTDQGVFATGFNEDDQLGLGDNVNRNQFTRVESIIGNPIAVSCGLKHSIILTEKDGVFVAGTNENGQIGQFGSYFPGGFPAFQHLNIEPIIAQIPYFPGTLETLAARRHYFAYYHPEGRTSQYIGDQLVQRGLNDCSIDNYINAINFTAVG